MRLFAGFSRGFRTRDWALVPNERPCRRSGRDGAIDGVQPTNNHAERALRSAVIYRKLCLGSQSEEGELRTARLLSAHTTCRLQHRSLFAYLTHAITAHARGHPAPLLT